jgi:hypothetical protein
MRRVAKDFMALQYAEECFDLSFQSLEKVLARISKWRFRPGNSRLSGKAPIRIKSVDMINRTPFHPRRILAFAQRRRNARHNCGRDFTDTTLCGSVNVPAEAGYNPEGALQNLAQP